MPHGIDDIPLPKRGIDPEFDRVNDKVNEMKKKIHQYGEIVRNKIKLA